MDIFELEHKSFKELRKIAEELNFPKPDRMKREGLIVKIAQALGEEAWLEIRGGVLEIMNEGIGFLRSNYRIGPDDVYVSQAQLRRYDLRSGDLVIGHARPPR